MKIIFLASIALLFVLTPVYGQLLSDTTGLVNRLDVQTGGYSFEVEIVSNFDIPDFEFDEDEKKLFEKTAKRVSDANKKANMLL